MFIKNYFNYYNSIKEGLIKTHEGDKSISYLIDKLRRLKFNVEGQYINKIIKLTFTDFNYIESYKIDDLFDMISAILTNKFGWFPSSMDIELTNGFNRLKRYDESEIKLKKSLISKLTIEFDSKFDDSFVYSGDLYHLSIQEYRNKILKNGLFPKSKSKLSSHLDRIYVCRSIEDCIILIPQMKLHYSEEKSINKHELNNDKYKKDTRYIIYKISGEYKLYNDPRYDSGYYILDNIDPINISIIEFEK